MWAVMIYTWGQYSVTPGGNITGLYCFIALGNVWGGGGGTWLQREWESHYRTWAMSFPEVTVIHEFEVRTKGTASGRAGYPVTARKVTENITTVNVVTTYSRGVFKRSFWNLRGNAGIKSMFRLQYRRYSFVSVNRWPAATLYTDWSVT